MVTLAYFWGVRFAEALFRVPFFFAITEETAFVKSWRRRHGFYGEAD